ncbi:hypothetical protein R2R70_11600 [Cobetia sp. SIMBA_158]
MNKARGEGQGPPERALPPSVHPRLPAVKASRADRPKWMIRGDFISVM